MKRRKKGIKIHMKEKVLALIITAVVMVGAIGSCITPADADFVYIEDLNVLDTTDYEKLDKALNDAMGIEEPEEPETLAEEPTEPPEPTPEPVKQEPKPVATPKPTPKPTPTPEPEPSEEPKSTDEQEEMTYLYSAYVTGYCPYCAHCCGQTTGITASGQKAVPWATVASNTLPFGTRIYIEGLGYFTVNDRGGMSGNTIDLCVNSHDEAYGVTGTYKIYKVN